MKQEIKRNFEYLVGRSCIDEGLSGMKIHKFFFLLHIFACNIARVVV